jgi:mRNA-degrading endonuclease RelE of RelBE toxin-antitoxin system
MMEILFTFDAKKKFLSYSENLKNRFLNALNNVYRNKLILKPISPNNLYSLKVGEYRLILTKNNNYLVVLDIITHTRLEKEIRKFKSK